MALFVPQGNDFQWTYSNISATRPVITGWGLSHTPSTTASTFSTWATLISSANITQDVYAIYLCFNSGSSSATIRNTLVNIGVDTAGGTNFDIKIPNLMAGYAAPLNIGAGGIWYYFPLYIPAGSSVGIQAGSTVATAFFTAAWVFGKPRRPESIRAGSYVTAFGATTGTTWRGTNVTPGTTADGTLTQIGTATTKSHWWWQAGFSVNDSTMTAAALTMDVLAGSSTTLNKTLIQDQIWITTGAEQISSFPQFPGSYNNVSTGENIYARLQSSTTADTGSNVIVYGLGG
jgi:hypothetical protein